MSGDAPRPPTALVSEGRDKFMQRGAGMVQAKPFVAMLSMKSQCVLCRQVDAASGVTALEVSSVKQAGDRRYL